MTRRNQFLLGAVLLAGVSAAALPVIAAESDNSAVATPVAWQNQGPDGGRDGAPWKQGRFRDMMRQRVTEKLADTFGLDAGAGPITKDQLNAAVDAKLKSYDKDGDGTLSLGEYQAWWTDMMRERMVRSFQRLDKDGDGKVTTAEANDGADHVLAFLDDDGGMGRGPGGWHHHHRPDGRGPGGSDGPDGGPDGAGAPPPPPAPAQ